MLYSGERGSWDRGVPLVKMSFIHPREQCLDFCVLVYTANQYEHLYSCNIVSLLSILLGMKWKVLKVIFSVPDHDCTGHSDF